MKKIILSFLSVMLFLTMGIAIRTIGEETTSSVNATEQVSQAFVMEEGASFRSYWTLPNCGITFGAKMDENDANVNNVRLFLAPYDFITAIRGESTEDIDYIKAFEEAGKKYLTVAPAIIREEGVASFRAGIKSIQNGNLNRPFFGIYYYQNGVNKDNNPIYVYAEMPNGEENQARSMAYVSSAFSAEATSLNDIEKTDYYVKKSISNAVDRAKSSITGEVDLNLLNLSVESIQYLDDVYDYTLTYNGIDITKFADLYFKISSTNENIDIDNKKIIKTVVGESIPINVKIGGRSVDLNIKVNPVPYSQAEVVLTDALYTEDITNNNQTLNLTFPKNDVKRKTEKTLTLNSSSIINNNNGYATILINNSNIDGDISKNVEITYKITYLFNGGSASQPYVSEYTISTENFNLPTSLKSEFSFMGWIDGENVITSLQKGTIGDKSLTAKYILKYSSIVNRLFNEEWKSKKDNLTEKTYQWSTQDPASVYNEQTGEYENWDANGDMNYKVRDDQNNSVTINLQGSGYVSRIWFAQVYKGGKIMIIIDGEEVVNCDLLEYISGVNSSSYGSSSAIWDAMGKSFYSNHAYSNLNHITSRGYNSFIPISFNESIKISFWNNTEESNYDAASFKQISYTLFDGDFDVESFVGLSSISGENKTALEQANSSVNFSVANVNSTFTISANNEVEVYNAQTVGAITMIRMSIPTVSDGNLQKTLRNTYIKGYWDDISTPAIEVSLGDFFGSPAQVETYQTYEIGVNDSKVFYLRMYMPYKKARFVLGNKLSSAIEINIEFTTETITEEEANDSLRFCVSWQKCVDRDVNNSRWPDSTTLSLIGRGRLVGQIWHTYQIYEGFWWGEGDERIFIDGEKTPSWEGTGAEDVVGYAYAIPYSWAFSTMFRAHPVGAESSGAVGDKINVIMFGGHSISFNSSIEMTLEKYFSDDYCLLSAISYYYLDSSDIVANYKPYTVTERNACAPLSMQELNVPSLYRYEGEFVNGMTAISRGSKYVQELGNGWSSDWSGGKQLCWYDCGNGVDNAYLSFPISVKIAGKYNLSAGFTVASDFVKVDVYVDNTIIAQNVDLYSATLSTKWYDFGIYDLTAGKHVIKFVVVGVNGSWSSNSTGDKCVFGLDYFDVTPQKLTRINSVDLKRLNLYTTGGEIRHQTADISNATNGNYLTFLNTSNQNGYITFDVDFAYAGNYDISFCFVKAFDFPIVTVYLDGNQIGNAVDLYHGGLKTTGKINFGSLNLTKGIHTFTVKTSSKNSKSAGYVFAIDYIDIEWNYLSQTVVYEVESLISKITMENGGNYWVQRDALCSSSLSNGAQFILIDNKVGTTITIPFNVPHTGSYSLYTQFCKAGDFAIFDVYVDGVKRLTYDAYSSSVTASGEVPLVTQTLTEGVHNIKIKITGKNSLSTGYVFAMDYIKMVYTTTERFTRFEAEDYYTSATNSGSGKVYMQDKDSLPDYVSLYSNGRVVALYPASQGNYFQFNITLDKNAIYEIRGVCVNATDLAQMQIYIDGIAIGDVIDCYASGERLSDIFVLGQRRLSAGTHSIKVMAVGKNSASSGYVLTLDYLDFVEV